MFLYTLKCSAKVKDGGVTEFQICDMLDKEEMIPEEENEEQDDETAESDEGTTIDGDI